MIRCALVAFAAIFVLSTFAEDGLVIEKRRDKFPERPKLDVEATPEQTQAIKRLIAQLGDNEFSVRAAAGDKLKEFGPAAIKELRAAVTGSADAEVQTAAKNILAEYEVETWDGYYYYSLEPFEKAIANGNTPVRFWFKVKRDDNGNFTAESDEEDKNLGEATIIGTIDRSTGELNFHKKYTGVTIQWRYEGKWNPEKGRIEGTYGPGSGGFVLYPHPQSLESIKK
jgi:hypothetical protein